MDAPAARITGSSILERSASVKGAYEALRQELAGTIVGQDDVVQQLLLAILCGGHALVEGVPGLAKTLIIASLAKTLSLDFKRIQFTPDLMPSDVTGTEVIQEDKATGTRELRFMRGPVFANIVLADEINRTPPKTQAALLEAMQEGQVTSGGTNHRLPRPFFVLATQNPIEQEGTYPLPEAQLDRFMFLIRIGYPTEAQELEIVRRTTGRSRPEPNRVLGAEDCTALQEIVREMPVPDHVISYALRIVRATRGGDPSAPSMVRDYLSWGAGPRASQFLVLAAKAKALLDGDPHVMVHHIRSVALPVLRHRIVTNFNAQADRVTSDNVIASLLDSVPVESTDPLTAKGLDRTMPVQ
jgi:MoxR-like ATPase